jgi:tetratricopeptide (TPR) repeat protein
MLAAAPALLGCFYGAHAFDPSRDHQTTPKELINEKYATEQDPPKNFFAAELRKIEPELKQRGNDADFVDDYAYVIYRTGNRDKALRLWSELLKKDPRRYTTLCSLATLYHNQSRFDDATTCLQTAIKQRPGFRSGAEELHLRMVEFQKRQLSTPAYATEHLFVDELTSVWNARARPPESFKSVKEFPDVSADGLAELLRAFPKFGDGWLALGIVLEHEGNHYLANRAYERALKYGSTRRQEIKNYLVDYSPFALDQDAGRIVARRLKWGIILGVIGTVLFFGLRFARAVILDISEARRAKEEANRPKKNDGPL